MHPFVQDRDFITVSPVEDSSIKIGDVVFYSTAEDRIIVHRVIWKYRKDGRVTMLIKGDATSGFPEKVDIQNIFGKVVAIERNGKKKKIDTKFYRIKGMFFAGISPLINWLYAIGSKVKRSIGYISNS
jgi:signal peptidase I